MTTPPNSARSRSRWLAGAVAVLLAAALVAGLVYVRLTGGHAPAEPARSAVQAAQASSGRPIGSLEMATRPGFSCSLPVVGYGRMEARISLPAGAVTLDQTLPQTNGGSAPFGSTYLHGHWLPVPAAAVSPDGRFYAYATQTTGAPGTPVTTSLNLHNVATGADEQLWTAPGHGLVAGWGPGGVYLTVSPPAPGGKGWIDMVEFWVVNPSQSSSAHRVGPNPPPPQPTGEASVPLFDLATPLLGGGGAWTVDVGQPIGPIPAGGAGTVRTPARIVRMDLRDGTLTTWLTAAPNTSLGLIGLDVQSHPVLTEYTIPPRPPAPSSPSQPSFNAPPPPRVLVLTAPDQTELVADGTDTSFRPGPSAAADAHGLWLTSPGSLWLYRDGHLDRVANVPVGLFPAPTPAPARPGFPSMPPIPTPPPGYPSGPVLLISGPCA